MILIFLLSSFLLSLIFNIKSLIFVFILFTILSFVFTRYSLKEILFLLLIFSIPIEQGLRNWNITVVPEYLSTLMSGYSFSFSMSIKLLLAISLLIILLFEKTKKTISISKIEIFLLLFTTLSLISSTISQNTVLSLTGIIKILYMIAIYSISQIMFKNHLNIKKPFFLLLVSILFFNSFIGVRQFISQNPLGHFLESSSSIKPEGFYTAVDTIYRSSGYTGHPTFFASFISMIVLIPLGILFQKNGWANKYFLSASFAFGFLTIIFTFSRSSWIVSILAIMYFIYINKKSIIKIKKPLLISLIILLFISFININKILSRASTFSGIWKFGSGKTRIELMKHALGNIKESPILGTGPNQFTLRMSQKSLDPELAYFIYPVHNTFLLFLSELGIGAGLSFIIFSASVLANSFIKSKSNPLHLAIWLGAISFIFNSQFHTLFNQDSSIDLFMIFAGYLSIL